MEGNRLPTLPVSIQIFLIMKDVYSVTRLSGGRFHLSDLEHQHDGADQGADRAQPLGARAGRLRELPVQRLVSEHQGEAAPHGQCHTGQCHTGQCHTGQYNTGHSTDLSTPSLLPSLSPSLPPPSLRPSLPLPPSVPNITQYCRGWPLPLSHKPHANYTLPSSQHRTRAPSELYGQRFPLHSTACLC